MTEYEIPADVRLPQTTGPYAIGTILAHVIDETRDETFTPDDPTDKRESMVQVWYPADVPESQSPGLIYPRFEFVQSMFDGRWSGVPYIYWDGFRQLLGNAVWDAPVLVSGVQYPILIYTHGDTSWRHTNIYLLEELASHGYVVASIDHTYNATAIQFPDGRIIRGGASSSSLHVQDIRFVLDRLQAHFKVTDLQPVTVRGI